ncbi:MAG: 30S ribosomal protein S9 [Candidatus Pacebacteria bacterium]|nr:30S ribosomal protein S9 [Candidatus Paceibacterota bacterium]
MTKKPAPKKASREFVYAVGRRRSASARVRLYKGKQASLVNNQPIADYFPGKVAEFHYTQPLKICDCLGKYYLTARVTGSGKVSQLTAVVHGLSRALDKTNPEKFHTILKKHKLLTRDSRTRERRKAGQAGRARHKKQSPKR